MPWPQQPHHTQHTLVQHRWVPVVVTPEQHTANKEIKKQGSLGTPHPDTLQCSLGMNAKRML